VFVSEVLTKYTFVTAHERMKFVCCQDDFAENREFITVLVYKNDGRRVFYPCEYHQSLEETY